MVGAIVLVGDDVTVLVGAVLVDVALVEVLKVVLVVDNVVVTTVVSVEIVVGVSGGEDVGGMTGMTHEEARARRANIEASRKRRLNAGPLTFI